MTRSMQIVYVRGSGGRLAVDNGRSLMGPM